MRARASGFQPGPPNGPELTAALANAPQEVTSAEPVSRLSLARQLRGPLEDLVLQHPEILDASDFACDDEDIDRIEDALGYPLPDEFRSLLRLTDGGVLRGPHAIAHLATADQLAEWAGAGVHQDLESIPFAHDAAGTVLVIDGKGEWGGAAGAVYRLRTARRAPGRAPVRDAVRLADSLGALLGHLAAGRDAF